MMSETYLQWLVRRSAETRARLERATPITPISTPLLEKLAKRV